MITRKILISAAVGGVVAASVIGGITYATAAEPPTDLHFMISTNADRSDPREMTGQRVSGRVAIFLKADTPVREVRFHIDDPTRTRTPFSVDATAPYDLRGTAADGTAVLFDTTTLAAGKHTFSAHVIRPNGGSRLINKTVTVDNIVIPPPPSSTGPRPTASPTQPRPSSSTATPRPPTGFPDERTTGVPAGTALRASGAITVTTAGTVLDALDVRGLVVIQAANVTIRRSRLNGLNGGYVVHVRSGNVLIEDSEITGGTRAAVCCGNFVLRRVHIHHVYEGPRMNGNATIESSYIHHLLRCDGCHIDALQSTGGSNIVIRGNNIQTYNPDLRDPMNAAFQFGEEKGPLRNCRVEGNLMNGGNFTVNGGGGGTTGAQCVFRNNRFQRDFRHGPAGNIGPGNSFDASNVYHDTGLPV